ncbi:response regulator [Massilia sp. H-1]|nr:response regulator [Massilia sp. H-1]
MYKESHVDASCEIQPDEFEILIVEDSPTQAERLRRLIQSKSYRVRVAANGRLALALLREHRPHLVLSDIIMPELNGYELCRAIKEDPALRGIPVILVTALNDAKDIIRGIECGADNFILQAVFRGIPAQPDQPHAGQSKAAHRA